MTGFDEAPPSADAADTHGSAELAEPASASEAAGSERSTQAELDLGVVPTGDERVDTALLGLEALPHLPVSEHPAVFDGVHQGLHGALTELDEG